MNKQVLKWNMIFQYGYVITNMINSLVLLPLYLHHIDASTLGVWLATGNILAWMTLIDPGVGDVLQQKIAALLGNNQHREIGCTVASGFVAALGILLLALVAGIICFYAIGPIINKNVNDYPHLATALLISVVATGAALVSFALSGINQGLQHAAPVAVSAISANILFLAVNIAFLLLGFGILSIALANLVRALFINGFNLLSMRKALQAHHIHVRFSKTHFKGFIRIFSFTSAASIIGGFSASMDTIVLARFIPPFMITIFEINKRPVQLLQALIGRHSVALMPVVSHAAGRGDQHGTARFIQQQFRYYSYAGFLILVVLSVALRDVIAVWAGPDKYAGNVVVYLLLANLFFGLIGYFMSNMGYAVGDIKKNSLVNIARGIACGVLYFPAASEYGIPGVLAVMLGGNLLIELLFFAYRLLKLGYLYTDRVKMALLRWSVLLPLGLIGGQLILLSSDALFGHKSYVLRMLYNSSVSALLAGILIIGIDSGIRQQIATRILTMFPIFRQIKHQFKKQFAK